MRFLLPIFALVFTVSAYEFDFKPKTITPNVMCFFGEPNAMNTTNNGNMVNTCYLDTGKSYVVIDSGSSYSYAASAYNAMQKLKALPVALVINTHIHDDHWLGNGFFAQMGVEVLGSEDFVRSVDIHAPTRMQTHISPEAYAKTVPTLPTEIISSDQTLSIGDQEIKIHIIAHKAHSAKDIVIFVMKEKTLFAGDLVFNDRVPSLIGGDINGWIEALDELKAYGASTIVGGHGYETDKDAMAMTYGYLSEMRSSVRNALDEGLGIEETMSKVDMPMYKTLRMYDTMHRSNVESAYRTLEWEQR